MSAGCAHEHAEELLRVTQRLFESVERAKRPPHVRAALERSYATRIRHEQELWAAMLQQLSDALFEQLNFDEAIIHAQAAWREPATKRFLARIFKETPEPPREPNLSEIRQRLVTGVNLDSLERGGTMQYIGTAMETGREAGQSALEHMGLHQTFEWAHPGNMGQALYEVRGSKVIQNLYGSHVDRLSQIIRDATRPSNPLTLTEVRSQIRSEWPALSRPQIDRIARTETAAVWTATQANAYQANGIGEFESTLAHGPTIGVESEDPCDECSYAASITHSMEDDLPPWHPNCRCEIVPVLEDEEGVPWLPPDEPWTGGGDGEGLTAVPPPGAPRPQPLPGETPAAPRTGPTAPATAPQSGPSGEGGDLFVAPTAATEVPALPPSPKYTASRLPGMRLTPKEDAAFRALISQPWIPDTLRAGKVVDEVQSIDGAMARSSLKAGTTYRGIRDPGAIFDALGLDKSQIRFGTPIREYATALESKVGSTFVDKGYMSTSLDRKLVEQEFGPLVMEMRVQAGVKGIYLPKAATFDSGESELLLDRNLNMTIREVRYDERTHTIRMRVDVTKPQPAVVPPSESIDAWVTDGSAVNMYLRGDTETAMEMLPGKSTLDFQRLADQIDAGMTTTTQPQMLWRGSSAWREAAGLRYDATPADLVGKEWTDPAFTSTDTSRSVAEAYGDGQLVFEINVPAGVRGMKLPTIAPTPGVLGQDEFVLASGTRFRVTSVENGVAHVDVVPEGISPPAEVDVAELRAKYTSAGNKISGLKTRLKKALAEGDESKVTDLRARIEEQQQIRAELKQRIEGAPAPPAATPPATANQPFEARTPGDASAQQMRDNQGGLRTFLDQYPDDHVVRGEGHMMVVGLKQYDGTKGYWSAWRHDGVIVKVEAAPGTIMQERVLKIVNDYLDGVSGVYGKNGLKALNVVLGDSPSNPEFAARFGMPNFSAAAEANNMTGEIWFWGENNLNVDTFNHEMGHIVGVSGGPISPSRWMEAQAIDLEVSKKYSGQIRSLNAYHDVLVGEKSVTNYGGNNNNEDWAESVMLYLQSERDSIIAYARRYDPITGRQGNGENLSFGDLFPARKQLIDEWLYDKPSKPLHEITKPPEPPRVEPPKPPTEPPSLGRDERIKQIGNQLSGLRTRLKRELYGSTKYNDLQRRIDDLVAERDQLRQGLSKAAVYVTLDFEERLSLVRAKVRRPR